MQQEIKASVAINFEILKCLQANGLLEADIRELIDLAKIGDFAKVHIDYKKLIHQLKLLKEMEYIDRRLHVKNMEK